MAAQSPPRSEALVLEAQGTRTVTSSGTRTQVRTGAAFQLHNMVLRPYLRAERLVAAQGRAQQEYVGLDARCCRGAPWPILGSFWLQGQVEAAGARALTSAPWWWPETSGPRPRRGRDPVGTRTAGADLLLSLVSQLGVVRSTSIVTGTTRR